MTQVSTLDANGSLKVKRHTLFLISHRANASSKERTKEEEQASSNHVIVQEDDDLHYSKIELTEALETLEDGGQAMVDKLKELNLRYVEKSHPIYVSAMLTPRWMA